MVFFKSITMMNGLTNRWAVLALIFLIGLALPMQFQAVSALAPFLVTQIGLTYTDVGILTGIFMVPGIFLAVPGGLLAARMGDKSALMTGLSLMFAGAVIFAATDSYTIIFFSRLLGGAGAVLITILLPKVVTDWFVGKEIATAQATVASSFGLGVGLAMAVLPTLADFLSWPIAIIANSTVIILAMLILLLFFKPHKAIYAQEESCPTLWNLNQAECVLSILAGIGRGLFGAGYVVLMSFTPLLLIGQGMPVIEAGLLTSLVSVVSIVSVPLGGVFSDWTGKPNYFIALGAVGTSITCILILYVEPTVLWLLLFGLLRGGCTGGIMALPSQVLRPESRIAGFTVVSAMYFISMAAFPAIAGYLLDATANTAAPLWFSSFLWILIPAMLATFKILQHKWRIFPKTL